MAKIPFGTQLFGEIRQPDGSSISTKFFHVAYVPLVPLGSYRVLEDYQDHFVGSPIGWHLGSLALGYFRIWGFLASLGLTAWAVYMFDRSSVPWSTLLLVPLAAVFLMAASTGSWHLFAAEKKPGRAKAAALWTGIPVTLMLAASGFLWMDRMEHDALVASSQAQVAKEEAAKEAARKAAAPPPLSRETESRINALNSTIYGIATAFATNKQVKTASCDDARIRAIATDDAALDLLVGDYDFLAYIDQRRSLGPARAWMMSPVVAALGPIPPDATLNAFDKRPFLAVLYTKDEPARRGKRTLTALLRIYERSTKALVCQTSFELDSTKGAGKSPPPKSLQLAFKARARGQLSRISKLLRIYEDDAEIARAERPVSSSARASRRAR